MAHQPTTALAVELLATGTLTWALLSAIVLPTLRSPSRQPRAGWPPRDERYRPLDEPNPPSPEEPTT